MCLHFVCLKFSKIPKTAIESPILILKKFAIEKHILVNHSLMDMFFYLL